MKLHTGTDITKISRFESFLSRSDEYLQEIYSAYELKQERSLEFFASRWAAKEAFYKALCALEKRTSSFKAIANLISIEKQNHIPYINFDRETFIKKTGAENLPQFNISLSISHEKEYALAFVIIYL